MRYQILIQILIKDAPKHIGNATTDHVLRHIDPFLFLFLRGNTVGGIFGIKQVHGIVIPDPEIGATYNPVNLINLGCFFPEGHAKTLFLCNFPICMAQARHAVGFTPEIPNLPGIAPLPFLINPGEITPVQPVFPTTDQLSFMGGNRRAEQPFLIWHYLSDEAHGKVSSAGQQKRPGWQFHLGIFCQEGHTLHKRV